MWMEGEGKGRSTVGLVSFVAYVRHSGTERYIASAEHKACIRGAILNVEEVMED